MQQCVFRLLSFARQLPCHRPALADATHGQHEEDGFKHILKAKSRTPT